MSPATQIEIYREKLTREVNYYRGYLALRKTYPLNRNFPGYFDFDRKTLPFEDKTGNLVFPRALSLKRKHGPGLFDCVFIKLYIILYL